MENESKIESFLTDNSKQDDYVFEFYNSWSSSYEQDVANVEGGYHPHALLAEALLPILENFSKTIRIIDIGCGSGLLGKEIKKLGFWNIDGLDGSYAMLEEAKTKNIYQNYYNKIVGFEKLASIEDETYDCLVSSGTFVPKHLTTKHLPTLIRIVKKGGIVGIIMRLEFLSTCPELEDLEPTLQQMNNDNQIGILKNYVIENYYNKKPGKIYIFKRL